MSENVNVNSAGETSVVIQKPTEPFTVAISQMDNLEANNPGEDLMMMDPAKDPLTGRTFRLSLILESDAYTLVSILQAIGFTALTNSGENGMAQMYLLEDPYPKALPLKVTVRDDYGQYDGLNMMVRDYYTKILNRVKANMQADEEAPYGDSLIMEVDPDEEQVETDDLPDEIPDAEVGEATEMTPEEAEAQEANLMDYLSGPDPVDFA